MADLAMQQGDWEAAAAWQERAAVTAHQLALLADGLLRDLSPAWQG
jgi:hypothetical protein